MIIALACASPEPGVDPEWASVRAAVDAWNRGSDALMDGRLDDAVADLREATLARPEDLLLRAWLAEAHARRGEFDAALTAFDSVLSQAPDFVEARRRRAALLVRMQRPEEAAADLAAAVSGDWTAARAARKDPEFAEVVDLPAFSFLPRETLLVAVEAPAGLVFWGTEASWRVRVVGADDHVVRFVGPTEPAPFDVRRVVESTTPSTEGPLRDLLFTITPTGAGEATLAGLQATAGPWSAPLPPISVRTAAPPDKGSGRVAVDLRTPADVLSALDDGDARYGDGALVVAGAPEDRVRVTPDPGPPQREWTWRTASGARAAWEWTGLTRAPARVQVEGDGIRRWDGPPAPARR